jgi:ATP-dependent exoDNAse (exonuclease V) alpha subunit
MSDVQRYSRASKETGIGKGKYAQAKSIDAPKNRRRAAALQRWMVVARLELDTHKRPHLDYFYTMTSHSSHGQTADRVLIHVDTELGAKDLLNSRLAHVSVSRGRYDGQIYTNNAQTLGQ